MTIYEVAEKIKQHLINLQNNFELPDSMHDLDVSPIINILMEADEEIAFGFNILDVIQQADENNISLSEDDAKEILKLIRNKADCSVGISWDTVDYFTNYYLEIV